MAQMVLQSPWLLSLMTEKGRQQRCQSMHFICTLLSSIGRWLWGQSDTLAWATGTRVGASDHDIALFSIEYGCVSGFVLRYITC